MRFPISIAAFSVAICVVTAPSGSCERLDDQPEVVSEYARGKRLLREGNWLGASRVFEQLAGQFPDSKNLDLFVFNRAKAVYYFGNYGEALAGFSSFVRSFPRHANAAHAHFFLGNIHYLRGQLSLAVAGYIKAYGLCNDLRLSELLVSSLAAAIAGARSVSLGPSDLEELPETKRCVLAQSLAEALVDRGEYAAAKDLLEPCGRELDVSEIDLDQKASFNAELELAVVLPLSGDLQSFGEDIYNGAIMAAEMYRRETGRDLRVISYDTRGDPSTPRV
jgi:tetratricopeptide (TPR) repeat protein